MMIPACALIPSIGGHSSHSPIKIEAVLDSLYKLSTPTVIMEGHPDNFWRAICVSFHAAFIEESKSSNLVIMFFDVRALLVELLF